MPVVPPSQIVAFIDRAYPWAAAEVPSVLETGNAPTVGAIVALVDGMPEGVLTALAPNDYALFLAAVAALKTSLPMWETPAHYGLQHRLGVRGELNNRHPVCVVRNLLVTCPDDAVEGTSTDFAFLGDPAYELVLRGDVAGAASALANGEYKAAGVLAGSIIEAILLWALQRRPASDYPAAWTAWSRVRAATGQTPPRTLDSDIRRWDLEQYISIAEHLQIISASTVGAALLAKSFRNLIHPGRVERLQQKPTLASSMLAVGAVHHLIDDVRDRVLAGTL